MNGIVNAWVGLLVQRSAPTQNISATIGLITTKFGRDDLAGLWPPLWCYQNIGYWMKLLSVFSMDCYEIWHSRSPQDNSTNVSDPLAFNLEPAAIKVKF